MTPFEAQIDSVVTRGGSLWRAFDGKPIFMTGGTGFFGRWLLASLLRARDVHGLKLEVTIVTRSVKGFAAKAPELAAAPCFRFIEGDVQDFALPEGQFPYVIHGAATAAKATFDGETPLPKFEMALFGARRVLELAARCQPERVLMLSSGNVYGGLSSAVGAIDEDYLGAPATFDTEAGLGHGKRASEFLSACYADMYGLNLSVARCFSFVGAYLPLSIHYAIGNFIHDALFADAITVRGDGTPIRSYLFAGDLVVWLVTMLVNGQSRRVYNVGSDRMVALGDLAHLVRDVVAPGKEVRILGHASGGPRSCYVPNIDRARTELDLEAWTGLDEAVRLTAEAARHRLWGDG